MPWGAEVSRCPLKFEKQDTLTGRQGLSDPYHQILGDIGKSRSAETSTEMLQRLDNVDKMTRLVAGECGMTKLLPSTNGWTKSRHCFKVNDEETDQGGGPFGYCGRKTDS